MVLSITAGTAAVAIDGDDVPLASIKSASANLAPTIDRATIEVPWGDRAIAGEDPPAEVLPDLGTEVHLTSGAWSWRGLLTARHRVGAGTRRLLRLEATGPSLALDRSYLPSFARSGLSGVVQAPGGPRFAPGTRSAAADGPGGTYYLGGTEDWTVGQAVAAIVAHAHAYAGLPSITIDSGSADLSRVLPDTDTDGQSIHAALQAVMGHRMGLAWRLLLTADGWVLRIRSLTGTGAQVDLTAGNVLDYDIGEDSSATLADLEVRGARKRYALSVDAYTSGSGDLSQDWTSGDEAARAAGNNGSPAFRRFRLGVFALPDGSPSVTADAVPSLPCRDDGTLSAGSSPWLVFAQRAADDTWVSLQGRVSVSVSGSTWWIEGIDPADWATWSRIRVTYCLAPRSHLSQTYTGGAGLGRGLIIVGSEHAVATGASVAVSGSSLDTIAGTIVSQSDPVDDAGDEAWAALSVPQWLASWTVDGVADTSLEPGDRVTSFKLPRPGTTPTVVACDCMVLAVTVSRRNGRMSTAFQVGPRPFIASAIK